MCIVGCSSTPVPVEPSVTQGMTLAVSEQTDTLASDHGSSVGVDLSSLAQEVTPQVDSSSLSLNISDELKSYFASGVALPATIKSQDEQVAADASEPIADIYITYSAERGLRLDKVELYPQLPFSLSADLRGRLAKIHDMPFDAQQRAALGDDLWLQMDVLTMNAEFVAAPTAFSVKEIKRVDMLGESSSAAFSDIMQYDVNGYHTSSSGGASRSAHVRLDNVASWQEHHINTQAYATQTESDAARSQTMELDELTYERDKDGRRLTVGMLNGWSMQSLGNVSTLYAQRLYGLSYGNKSDSVKYDGRQSLTPLVVYLPASGEVRVYRDGRLLTIQQMAMGNQELDTANFPAGIYDVKAEVVIAGKIVSSRTYRVNKLTDPNAAQGLQWQVWGGASEISEYQDQFDQDEQYLGSQEEERLAPLVGVSLASHWNGVDWNTSLYHNDKTQVIESQFAWPVNEVLSLDVQTLAASDSSLRGIATANLSLLNGAASMWLSSERGQQGDELNYGVTDQDTLGGSLFLGTWLPSVGSVNANYQQDHTQNARYWSADYSHNIDAGDFGFWTLTVGTNVSEQQDTGERTQDRYATLNVSLPLSSDFSVGMSQQEGNRTLNLAGRHQFEGPITDVGVDMSMSETDRGTQTHFGSYARYDTRYAQGTLAYSHGEDSQSVSLSNRGVVTFGEHGLASGDGRGESAIIVTVPDHVADDELFAMVNQRQHALQAGENVIMVPGFEDYEVVIERDAEATNSYEIEVAEQVFTLYPGNVARLEVGIKQMMTVFGRLTDAQGDPLRHARVKNHIGETVTDANGQFSIDVDAAYPEVQVDPQHDRDPFKVEMSLPSGESTAWLGDIIYNGPPSNRYRIQTII